MEMVMGKMMMGWGQRAVKGKQQKERNQRKKMMKMKVKV